MRFLLKLAYILKQWGMIHTKIVIFSESNQPEIDRSHAGVADKRHSFIWCFETRLFVLESF